MACSCALPLPTAPGAASAETRPSETPKNRCGTYIRWMSIELMRKRLAADRASFIEPCLPSPADKPPSGADWIHEIKHDGFRGRARLLDHAVLQQQLAGLERRAHSGNRETVGHGASHSAHDDVATSVCGALALLGGKPRYDANYEGWSDAPVPPQPLVTGRATLWAHIMRYG